MEQTNGTNQNISCLTPIMKWGDIDHVSKMLMLTTSIIVITVDRPIFMHFQPRKHIYTHRKCLHCVQRDIVVSIVGGIIIVIAFIIGKKRKCQTNRANKYNHQDVERKDWPVTGVHWTLHRHTVVQQSDRWMANNPTVYHPVQCMQKEGTKEDTECKQKFWLSACFWLFFVSSVGTWRFRVYIMQNLSIKSNVYYFPTKTTHKGLDTVKKKSPGVRVNPERLEDLREADGARALAILDIGHPEPQRSSSWVTK